VTSSTGHVVNEKHEKIFNSIERWVFKIGLIIVFVADIVGHVIWVIKHLI
jgi:hypothetical protein